MERISLRAVGAFALISPDRKIRVDYHIRPDDPPGLRDMHEWQAIRRYRHLERHLADAYTPQQDPAKSPPLDRLVAAAEHDRQRWRHWL